MELTAAPLSQDCGQGNSRRKRALAFSARPGPTGSLLLKATVSPPPFVGQTIPRVFTYDALVKAGALRLKSVAHPL